MVRRQYTALGSILLAALILGSVGSAAVQDRQLANAGTTPGSFLYELDRAAESISIALTFSKEKKAEKKLKYAEERLSEAQKVAEKGKRSLADRAEEEYSRTVDEAKQYGDSAGSTDTAQKIDATVSAETSEHMMVLEENGVDPGEVGYSAKRKAEDVTVATEEDSVEKASKQARVAGHRVNESSRLADEGRTDEAAQVAQEYEQEMQKLDQIGQQISDAAKQRKIQEVVAKATQAHQKVLQKVYENVPEQAQDSIQQAMERSQTGHQQAVQELRQSGGVPEGISPDTPTAPAGQGPGSSEREDGQTPEQTRDSGEITQDLTDARNLMEDGRQALQQANDHLDRNETMEAEAAFAKAADHFDQVLSELRGVQGQEAQQLRQEAQQSKTRAETYEQETQDYNQQTGQSDTGGTDGSGTTAGGDFQ